MFWNAILKTSLVVSLVASVKQLYDNTTREVSPHKLYNSVQVARFLGLTRKQVVELVKKKELVGKSVSGNYRIPGQSILEYLNKK